MEVNSLAYALSRPTEVNTGLKMGFTETTWLVVPSVSKPLPSRA